MIRPFFFLLACCAILSTAARAQDGPALHLATTPVDGGAAVYYAYDLGLFKKHGLNVDLTTLPSGSAVAAGVAAGTFDFAQSSIPPLVAAHVRGIPFVLVMTTAISRAGENPVAELLTLPASPIRSGRDLTGKTVAVNSLSDVTVISTRSWIDANGGDSATVHYIEIPFAQMWPALTAGRVDAAFIATPSLEVAQQAGARVLGRGFASIAPAIALGAWFTTHDYAAAHPANVRAFVDAIVEAGRWANAHHAESATILAKYAKITISPAMARAHYATTLDAADIQPLIDASVRYGLLTKPFPATDLFATQGEPR